MLRPNDPTLVKLLIDAKLETLRGRRPRPTGRRYVPRGN